MSNIFVLTNHKGGVGKSTTAANLAYGIVRLLTNAGAPNPRVLLIDTDSQGHATLITTSRNDFGADNSLYTVLMAGRADAVAVLADCIAPSTWDENLHVLPASPLLEGAERELISVAGAPYRISRPLNRIATQYAAVVIDTRPSFSLLTEMGLLAATDALIPIEPRYLETIGLQSVINKIQDVREGWQHLKLQVSGIVVTKMDRRMRGHIEMLDNLYAHPVLGKMVRGVIPSNEAVAYAHQSHLSIIDFDSRSPAATAYVKLAHTVLKNMYTLQEA